MAEASSIGIAPHILIDYTPRELYAAMVGAGLNHTRDQKMRLWQSWTNANFTRAKRLPELAPLLRKIDPSPVKMSAKAIRQTVFAMASALGAKVTRIKRKG